MTFMSTAATLNAAYDRLEVRLAELVARYVATGLSAHQLRRMREMAAAVAERKSTTPAAVIDGLIAAA